MRARNDRSTALTSSTTRRRQVLAYAFVFAFVPSVGCDNCKHRPTPSASDLVPDASLIDMAPEPDLEELTELWKRAAAGLTVGDGEAFPLGYTIPKCSVRYELRSLVLAEVSEGRPPAGVEIVAEVVGNPDTSQLTWQVISLRSYLLHDGERTSRPRDTASWAPALVHTDGEAWREDQGPSSLWAASDGLPPLGAQFPKLPKGSKLGSRYKWQVDSFAKRTTTKIEKRREDNPDARIPNLVPDSYEADIEVSEWIRLSWQQEHKPRSIGAAVLKGSWSVEKRNHDPIESHRAERWKGRWVIAETGRLVHAISISGNYRWWATSPKEHNSKLGSAEIELRLIEDCDTPTLPRFVVATE
jgi:hypothetical protein